MRACNVPNPWIWLALSCRYVENGGDQDADPLTLTLPLTGHEIDTSFYSRLRKQSDETSGTVMG